MRVEDRKRAACKRLGLADGQFFAIHHPKCRNLRWYLDGAEIGFGDLRLADIERIKQTLTPDEIFVGFNEHHMTYNMQRESPMIIITDIAAAFPEFRPVKIHTRNKIRKDREG